MKAVFFIILLFLFGFFTPFGDWVNGLFAQYKEIPVGDLVANVTGKLPSDMRAEMTDAVAEAKAKGAQWRFFQKAWWKEAFTKSTQ